LKAEFTQHENLLKDLEADAEKFRAENKLEAAERLDQQLSLLKVRLCRGGEVSRRMKIMC